MLHRPSWNPDRVYPDDRSSSPLIPYSPLPGTLLDLDPFPILYCSRHGTRVKAIHKAAPGIDDMSGWYDFMAYAREHLGNDPGFTVLQVRYQPLPVIRVEIPKPTGGTRPLGIPTVLDRLIQQAIAQVLFHIFDPHFSEFSFGFRNGRSAHDAVYTVREYIRQGYRVAVDADLSKFFDTVDHDCAHVPSSSESP